MLGQGCSCGPSGHPWCGPGSSSKWLKSGGLGCNAHPSLRGSDQYHGSQGKQGSECITYSTRISHYLQHADLATLPKQRKKSKVVFGNKGAARSAAMPAIFKLCFINLIDGLLIEQTLPQQMKLCHVCKCVHTFTYRGRHTPTCACTLTYIIHNIGKQTPLLCAGVKAASLVQRKQDPTCRQASRHGQASLAYPDPS